MGDRSLSLHEGSYPGCQVDEPVMLVYKQEEQTMSSRRVVSNTALCKRHPEERCDVSQSFQLGIGILFGFLPIVKGKHFIPME